MKLVDAIRNNTLRNPKKDWFDPVTISTFKRICVAFNTLPASVLMRSGDRVELTPEIVTIAMAKHFDLMMKMRIKKKVTNDQHAGCEDHLIISGHHINVWSRFGINPELIHSGDPKIHSFHGGEDRRYIREHYADHPTKLETIEKVSEFMAEAKQKILIGPQRTHHGSRAVL